MSKREQIQQEALQVALSHQRTGLAISMGVGKTLIGLRYIDYLWHNEGLQRILVVAPKKSIFQSWLDDMKKFSINPDIEQNIQFTTYLSLNKKDPNLYDIVILDECHSLKSNHLSFLGVYENRLLGLTGTPPRYIQSEKGQMVSSFCPILYKYITDEAVEDGILNDYQIFVHYLELSRENTYSVSTKKTRFYTSEQKSYQYWTQRILDASSKKEEKIASVMRMRSMMDYPTKEWYTKQLLLRIQDKCIVFCNTQDQADRICQYSYHTGNQESTENLQLFKEGQIDQLSCVLQLNEGINIPQLKSGIILHAYGNERKSSQRIGRLLRLNPDEKSTIHILCYKNTIDERWVTEALKDLDQEKISYINVNQSKHELLNR